jgi:hypothetical protein
MRRPRARNSIGKFAVIGGALLLVCGGSASATKVVFGNLAVYSRLKAVPSQLPPFEYAPVLVDGATRLTTTDGSHPPATTDLKIDVPKDVRIQTRGFPICRARKLEATTTLQAIRACPHAILGTGFAEAEFKFPDQAPVSGGSPLTFFNGPSVGGTMTVFSHSYSAYPAPTTILVRFRIRRIEDARFGYRVEGHIPKLAGGAGSVIYTRFLYSGRWSYKGGQLGFIESRCPVPGPRLLGRTITRFDDGRSLAGSFFGGCQARTY